MRIQQQKPQNLPDYNFKQHTSDNNDEVTSMLESSSPIPNTHSIPGFPTYEHYKRLESSYLASLHSNKRQKALINQVMFDRIWDTFTQPRSRNETPQFRFWVRKTFTLSHPLTQPCGPGKELEVGRPILLHDNRPVAIQEQIYNIICYCHARAEHGGRDKTRAIVRELYSWVPKELVSRFVKACPTCTLKRCGNSELVAIVEQHMGHPGSLNGQHAELVLPTQFPSLMSRELGDRHEEQPAVDWPKGGGPVDYPKRSFSKISGSRSESPPSTASSDHSSPLLGIPFAQGTHTAEAPFMARGAGSQPMTREVSLYNGLPNGWQYDIHEKGKDWNRYAALSPSGDPRRTKRPRIPSVLPFNDIDNLKTTFSDDKENERQSFSLPPISNVLSDGVVNKEHCAVPIRPQSSLPPSLHRFQVFSPVRTQVDEVSRTPYVPQIDPVLMQDDNRQHAIHSERKPLLSRTSCELDSESNESSVPSPTSNTVTKPTTAKETQRASSPLKSFQSFQHLVDWKSSNEMSPSFHLEDDSPLSPFSPRPGSSTSTAAGTSRFSTFRVAAAAATVAPDEEAFWSSHAETRD